jgi:tyrosyl-tRNA synthetase
MFAREYLPKLGYRPRVEFMTPLIPALSKSGKMSASDKASKIDLIDPADDVSNKMNSAFCPEGEVENNGVLAFCRYVLMTIKQDRGEELVIERPEKWGGNLNFKTYDELETAFVKKELHPMDLKKAVAREVNKLLDPIRNKMESHQDIVKEAYPDE